jgi:hypothetical protein
MGTLGFPPWSVLWQHICAPTAPPPGVATLSTPPMPVRFLSTPVAKTYRAADRLPSHCMLLPSFGVLNDMHEGRADSGLI